jgi:hypothetical protein
MKHILNGVPGAACILIIFCLSSVYLSSCSNEPKFPVTVKLPIRLPIHWNDSSAGAGSGTGLKTKVIVVLCGAKGCLNTPLPDPTATPSGTLTMDMVFTTTDSIPANSVVHLKIYQTQDSASSSN